MHGVPTITRISPASGPVGTVVTIKGTDLVGAIMIKFNNATTTKIIKDTATKIKVKVPTGAKTGKITVITADGSVDKHNEVQGDLAEPTVEICPAAVSPVRDFPPSESAIGANSASAASRSSTISAAIDRCREHPTQKAWNEERMRRLIEPPTSSRQRDWGSPSGYSKALTPRRVVRQFLTAVDCGRW